MPNLNPFRCFACGQPGHVKANCPTGKAAAPKVQDTPAGWCGTCDPTTRQIDNGTTISRCHWCHPLRAEGLAQHVNCGGCGNTKYAWDKAPCGKHQVLAHEDQLVFASLRG
jgi:hypothetical protein